MTNKVVINKIDSYRVYELMVQNGLINDDEIYVLAEIEAVSNDNYYHTPMYSAGFKIATGIGVEDIYVPVGTASTTLASGSHTHSLNDLNDTLGVFHGGTGSNTVVGALENLGLTAVRTSGSGAAYTATVPGITALTAGVSFIMVPHTVSTSTTPTLNVNSLGAKTIKRRLSTLGTSLQSGYTNGWLGANLPFRVTYDGTYWVVEGQSRPVAADIYGTVSAATKATQDGSGNVITDTYATKTYVDDAISAAITAVLEASY